MALQKLAVVGKAGVGQALKVLLIVSGPALTQSTTTGQLLQEKADCVLAVEVALEVDKAHDVHGGLGLGGVCMF